MKSDDSKIYSVEVLLSTMHQKDLSILKKVNIQTNAVVINQANSEKCIKMEYEGNDITWISSSERGLSKSRNLALRNARGDICLLCDDDVQYVNGYRDIVLKAFNEVKDADIIIFDSLMTDRNGQIVTKGFTKIKRIHRYKTYSSVLIAFRREVIEEKKIEFDYHFGTGSGMYSMCEDSIFLRECYKKGLKAYSYPSILHTCVYGKSTWFNGYNEKYFFDIGAFLARSYGSFKHIVKWYYPFRMKNICDLPMNSIMYQINNGIKAYKKGMGYDEYYK